MVISTRELGWPLAPLCLQSLALGHPWGQLFPGAGARSLRAILSCECEQTTFPPAVAGCAGLPKGSGWGTNSIC